MVLAFGYGFAVLISSSSCLVWKFELLRLSVFWKFLGLDYWHFQFWFSFWTDYLILIVIISEDYISTSFLPCYLLMRVKFCLIWKQILMFWKLGLFFIDFSSESFIGQSVVFRRLKRNIKALSALITYLVLINSVCRYILEGSLSFIQQIINVIGEKSRVNFFFFQPSIQPEVNICKSRDLTPSKTDIVQKYLHL